MTYVLLAGCFAISAGLLGKEARPVYSGLTVHEWGTFTSVAGHDGQAVQWSPLTGSTDLPEFVEHFRDPGFKLGLRGTVRMETPVLYFYDSREETVSVKVSFSKGVITEWYPHASQVAPSANLYHEVIFGKQPDGSIAWDAVTVSPQTRSNFPQENTANHYYAARATSATPLRVNTPRGQQYEKFLFYRGVGAFAVPLATRVTTEGKLFVENRGAEEIPAVLWFERRGEKVGYRIGGAVADSATLHPPELTSTVEDLGRDLEGILVAQGLYQDEAQAMVNTWRNSWFEEGSRLLYIVPKEFVNRVLPLSITPAPQQTERVFVGRLEIVTPATEKAIERALVSHDTATIAKYGRFLEPILQEMSNKETNPLRARLLQAALGAYYSAVVAKNPSKN